MMGRTSRSDESSHHSLSPSEFPRTGNACKPSINIDTTTRTYQDGDDVGRYALSAPPPIVAFVWMMAAAAAAPLPPFLVTM